ncbi:MAG: hypothetical protein FH748_15400 [Balneolaceae bacterium]|nr:hypothetical protein [Balneolaceae bacterium]
MGDIISTLAPFAWVLIPLAAMAVGAFSEWLKFKEKQTKLDASTEGLAREVRELKQTIQQNDEEFNKRLRHLETIVTSQLWDVINEDPGDTQKKIPSHMLDEMLHSDEELTDKQKSKIIAKKLKS